MFPRMLVVMMTKMFATKTTLHSLMMGERQVSRETFEDADVHSDVEGRQSGRPPVSLLAIGSSFDAFDLYDRLTAGFKSFGDLSL